MHIFVDEAGSFIIPAKRARYSCVGALVIPDASMSKTMKVAKIFKRVIGLGDDELKGHRLTEGEANGLIQMLAPLDVFYEAVVFDSHAQSLEELRAHRAGAAEGVTKHVTEEHHPNLRAELIALWEMDPKCDRPARRKFGNYDRLFYATVKPWLQAASVDEPMIMLEGADYSHFSKFEDRHEATPAHLLAALGDRRPTTFNSVTKMMKDFSFPSSKDSLGLQLADALTTSLKRVLNRTLDPSAISPLPSLMVQAMSGHQPISLLALGTANSGPNERVTDSLISELMLRSQARAKPMIHER